MSSKIPVAISFTGVANFLGVVGIIGSLIFVGLELRQTQRIALASQVQERTNNISNAFIAPMSGNMDAMAHWYIPYEQQTESQQRFSQQFKRWQSNMYENNFYQYQIGLMSEEHWHQQEFRIRRAWLECEYRANYENRLPSFMAYLATLPDSC